MHGSGGSAALPDPGDLPVDDGGGRGAVHDGHQGHWQQLQKLHGQDGHSGLG